jgi:aminoglycoside 2'-N-acetyltransferase I
MHEVRVVPREALSQAELRALLAWLEAAYDEGPWRPEHWDDIGPGPHLMIEDEAGLAAHACLDLIEVHAGDRPLVAGYVEDVATRADRRGQGLATALMEAAAPLLHAQTDLGLLATGSFAFYGRLGWVRWEGPLSVREADGSITRTPEEDGFVMALFGPRTPGWVRTDLPLTRPRRDPEEAW